MADDTSKIGAFALGASGSLAYVFNPLLPYASPALVTLAGVSIVFAAFNLLLASLGGPKGDVIFRLGIAVFMVSAILLGITTNRALDAMEEVDRTCAGLRHRMTDARSPRPDLAPIFEALRCRPV